MEITNPITNPNSDIIKSAKKLAQLHKSAYPEPSATKLLNIIGQQYQNNILNISKSIEASVVPNISKIIEASIVPNISKIIGTSIAANSLQSITVATELFRKDMLRYLERLEHTNRKLIPDVVNINRQFESQILMATALADLRVNVLNTLSVPTTSLATARLSASLATAYSMPTTAYLLQSFAQDLASIIREATSDDFDVRIDDEFVDEIDARISEQVESLPSGRLSASIILQIYGAIINTLMLLLVIASLVSSYETGEITEQLYQAHLDANELLREQIRIDKERSEQLLKLAEKWFSRIENLESTEEEKILFVVKKIAPLRERPKKTGHVITKLYPNQEVELIKKERDWVYVSYFDYEEGVLKAGWVYRRNLILLK